MSQLFCYFDAHMLCRSTKHRSRVAPGPISYFPIEGLLPGPAMSPFFERNLVCQKTCIDKLLTDSAARQFYQFMETLSPARIFIEVNQSWKDDQGNQDSRLISSGRNMSCVPKTQG